MGATWDFCLEACILKGWIFFTIRIFRRKFWGFDIENDFMDIFLVLSIKEELGSTCGTGQPIQRIVPYIKKARQIPIFLQFQKFLVCRLDQIRRH